MKYWFLSMLLLTTHVLTADGQQAAATNILVRLVAVSHSQSVSPYLIATFVSVGNSGPFGGGGGNFGGSGARPNEGEKRIGEEFTVRFMNPGDNAHAATIWNIINSCQGSNGARELKLDLLLYVPASAQKATDLSPGDLSQWIINSVEIHK